VILVAQAPFVVVNMLPGLAGLVLQPLVSVMLLYAYFNGRALREQQSGADAAGPGTDQQVEAVSGGRT